MSISVLTYKSTDQDSLQSDATLWEIESNSLEQHLERHAESLKDGERNHNQGTELACQNSEKIKTKQRRGAGAQWGIM